MCSARLGSRLYLIGGASETQSMRGEDDLESLVGTRTVDVFDFASQTWDTTTACLSTPRAYATAVALDDSIYVMGGVDNDGHILNSVEVYDPTKDQWHYADSMHYRRKGASAAAFGDSIFVFGGGGEYGVLHRAIEVYSPQDGTWLMGDTTIYGRAFHHAVRIKGYIYIFGGIGSVGGTVVGPIKNVERFDPATGADSALSLALDPRLFFDVVVRNDSVFEISGYGSSYGNGYYGDIALLDFRAVATYQYQSKLMLRSPRAGFVADIDDRGFIYVFGGVSPGYKQGQLPVAEVEVIPSSIEAVNYTRGQNTEPVSFSLLQNYPNPFNPSTRIGYQVPAVGRVVLKVYDVVGREVRTLVDRVESPGKYEVQFNAENLPSGAYIYELRSANGTFDKKMVLIK
jgi:N-acetylneuraminic acid mutarotase